MKDCDNTTDAARLEPLRRDILRELQEGILSYWLEKMQDPEGGFHGRRDGCDALDAEAPRGAILNARILWTFSAAYNALHRPEYLEAAEKEYRYIRSHFIDREFGGAYWSVDAQGRPLDTKKQFYAIAFVIYGLAEYYEASGDREALDLAMELFDSIEEHSLDRELGGYLEAATREWKPIEDMRLSDKDDNAPKTMNTHLHILEAYSNLYRVSKDPRVGEALRGMIRIFLDRIIDPAGDHMNLFFAEDWTPVSADISFGHDIEASWLLHEAACNLGDEKVTAEVEGVVPGLARGALRGYSPEGWMAYEELASGERDTERHWWVQAETVAGLLWLASRLDLPEKCDFIRKGELTFRWIEENLVDREEGEWYWSRLPDGTINRRDDKAGFWKCPYHNARMCLEANAAITRLEA